MKRKLQLLLFTLILSSLHSFAQNKVETRFIVDGVCGMCKERIENTLDVKGIWVAEWNLKTHELYCVFKPDVISLEEIHKLLNDAGHDTDKSKATEKNYLAIDPCCYYRDPEVVKAHN